MEYDKHIRQKYDELKNSWRSGFYFQPATITTWALYGMERLIKKGNDNLKQHDLE
jgi:hypothetical protein